MMGSTEDRVDGNRPRRASGTDTALRVLQLVTNERAPFYQEQVSVIEDAGVVCRTVAVPDREATGRRRRDYVRFYGRVLGATASHYDLVHANYGLTAPAALAQPRRPVVLSLWGSDLLGRYGRLSNWCASRANGVIVMSQQMQEKLDTDAAVIPHGIDLEKFRPEPRVQARRAVGWRGDSVNVLFPYDPDRSVKNHPRAKRVVERVAATTERPVRLRTVSGIDHERVPDYMNAADVLLVTSESEGSPNAVREALACDLPVVSTDVGDVAEHVGPLSYSGVGADDDELVERVRTVVTDAPVSEGRAQVHQYGLDAMQESLLGVYDEVLDRPVPSTESVRSAEVASRE